MEKFHFVSLISKPKVIYKIDIFGYLKTKVLVYPEKQQSSGTNNLQKMKYKPQMKSGPSLIVINEVQFKMQLPFFYGIYF